MSDQDTGDNKSKIDFAGNPADVAKEILLRSGYEIDGKSFNAAVYEQMVITANYCADIKDGILFNSSMWFWLNKRFDYFFSENIEMLASYIDFSKRAVRYFRRKECLYRSWLEAPRISPALTTDKAKGLSDE